MLICKTSDLVLREMTLGEYTDVFSEPVSSENRGRTDGNVDWFSHSESFYCGLASNDEARKLLRHGWHDGVKKLLSLKSKVELPPAKDRRRKLRRGDDGDELCIERALRGEWDTAWSAARRAFVAGTPTIDLVGFMGGTAARSAEAMFWGGAAAVVLVDALEAAGYSVRLVAGNVATMGMGEHAAGIFVTLKDAGEPLRSDVVAAVMCHGGMHRTHTFRARLTLPTKISESMGATKGLHDYGIERMVREAGVIGEDAIILSQTYDLDSCRAQIQRVIAQLQGGES